MGGPTSVVAPSMFHCNGDELPPSRPAAVETRAVWERHAPASEPIANSLLASLLLEDLVPEGGILDVGAFDGVFANFYAELMPHRTIYAIDPSMENIKKMRIFAFVDSEEDVHGTVARRIAHRPAQPGMRKNGVGKVSSYWATVLAWSVLIAKALSE